MQCPASYPRIDTERRSNRRITGQGLTEYIIIVALIAIASIVAVSFFGSSVKASFLALGTDLTGGAPVDKAALTDANFKAAEAAAKAKTTLQNYNQ
jgi:Flp pilus assembly pilin Flp